MGTGSPRKRDPEHQNATWASKGTLPGAFPTFIRSRSARRQPQRPGGAVVRVQQMGIPANGATLPSHEIVQEHERKFEVSCQAWQNTFRILCNATASRRGRKDVTRGSKRDGRRVKTIHSLEDLQRAEWRTTLSVWSRWCTQIVDSWCG